MEKKIPVKTLYLLLVIGIGLIGLGVGSTYAVFTTSAEISNPIVLKSDLSYTSDIIETVDVEVPAGGTVTNTLNITNSSGGTLNYVAWYLDDGYDIEVGTDGESSPTGSLANGASTSVVVAVTNNTSGSVTVTIGIASSGTSSVVLGKDMETVSDMRVVPNPLSDFNYVLGSETPVLTEYESNSGLVEFPSISLAEDEILLTEYVGDSTEVIVPSTYTVDGTTYNVTVLSYHYYYYYNDPDGEEIDVEFGVFLNNSDIESVSFGNNVRTMHSEFYDEYYAEDDYYTNGYLEYDDAYFLFYYCTNLKFAKLPNTVIDLEYTFYACENLVTAPEIPSSVTNLSYTFQNCTSLVNAPVIPNSVTSMTSTFSSCTSLVNAPEIPNSVTSMTSTFAGCTSLVNAPVIPSSVTNLSYTFQICTSLVNAPEIPSSVTSMIQTFYGCTSLVIAPELPSSVTSLSYTFYGCASLVTAPEIPNSVTSLIATFGNCTSLVTAPEIPSSVTDMSSTFYGCTNLVNAPEIPNSVTNMYETFRKCTNLTGTVRINSSSVTSLGYIFSLTTKPITVEVPAGSTTYTNLSKLTTSNGMPSNVTLSTFTAS